METNSLSSFGIVRVAFMQREVMAWSQPYRILHEI